MLRTLLIEDDEKFATDLKAFMEGPGSKRSFLRFDRVDWANTCEQAIELAGRGIAYDLIIYDFQLPWSQGDEAHEENGVPLIQQIRPLQRSACGILVSNFTGNRDVPLLEQIGAVSRLVPKPASFQEILLVAEDAILEAARKTFERLSASYQEQARIHEAMNSLNNILAAASEIEMICSSGGDFVPSRSLPLIREEIENIRRFEQAAEMSLRDSDSGLVGRREPCDLRQIAEKCLSYLRHQYRKQQDRLGLHIEGDPPSTLGIREELEQLVLMLATNALQAAEDRGRVTIALTFDAQEGGEIVLSVKDDGPGIPPALRDRVFERGFTTQSGRRTGQGLFLARAFVWNHGGKIQVDSTEGKGTLVTVRLPVREVPADA